MISAILMALTVTALCKETTTIQTVTTPEVIVVEETSPSMNYMGDSYYEDTFMEQFEEDIPLLVRCCMSEAGGQPMECKEAVVTTILNRYFSPNHPNDISRIIAESYSTADNGEPNAECYQAVENALKNYATPDQVIPWCCYYFRGGHYHEWAQDYRKIGDLYFSVPADACVD